jgi:arylsulfatase A-like enzyme
MNYTFDQANANAPSKRDTQYFEMVGNRAVYHDGWIAATTPPAPPWELDMTAMPPLDQYKSELYYIMEDYSEYSEYNDLAAKNPDKLKELQALFLTEAGKYHFPIGQFWLRALAGTETGPEQVVEPSLIILVAQCRGEPRIVLNPDYRSLQI